MSLNLSSASPGLIIGTILITAALPIGITAWAMSASAKGQFPWTMFLAASIPMLVIGLGLGLFMLRGSATIVADRLELKGAFYSRTIKLSELDLDNALILDESNQDRAAFTLRTNGIGLPGYLVGWFRMKGHGKAFALITRTPPNLLLPTTQDFTIVLTVEDPQRALDLLRRAKTE